MEVDSASEPARLDFKVDRELLDPQFDGYQLRVDDLPIEQLALDGYEMHSAPPTEAQWSYQHVSLFGRHQHAFVNPYEVPFATGDGERQVCWFTADGRVAHALIDAQTGKWTVGPGALHKFSAAEWSDGSRELYPASVVFIGSDRCLASTPSGHLTLFDCGGASSWTALWAGRCDLPAAGYALLDACESAGGDVYVAVQSIDERPLARRAPGSGSAFVTRLHLFALRHAGDAWSLSPCGRPACTRGNVLFAALQRSADAAHCGPLLVVVSSMHLRDEAALDAADANGSATSGGERDREQEADAAAADADNGAGDDGAEPPPAAEKEPYNVQELEQCDADGADALVWSVLRCDDAAVICTGDAGGRQLLFALPRAAGAQSPPVVCLRHDVDGLLWTLECAEEGSGGYRLKHAGTLNAFGFVLASKTKRHHVSCGRSALRAAFSETHRRLFVYETCRPLADHVQLYNRKRKQPVDGVAVQRVLQLPDNGAIVAMHMVGEEGDVLLAATEGHLYAVRLAAPVDSG